MGLGRRPGVSEAPVPTAGVSGDASWLGAQGWRLDVPPGRPPPADDALVKVCCLLFARGWRIQWSIVPEVSEVVVSPGRGSVMGSGCVGGHGPPKAPRAGCVGTSGEPCPAGSAQRGDGWLLPPRALPG